MASYSKPKTIALGNKPGKLSIFFVFIAQSHRKMQTIIRNQTKERPQLPPKMSSSGHKKGELYVGGYLPMSPRSRPACTCLNRPGSVQCARCGYVVPGERLKKPQGNKEVLKRALMPTPPRRIGLRWLNFRPTPSRLSNMSMA